MALTFRDDESDLKNNYLELARTTGESLEDIADRLEATAGDEVTAAKLRALANTKAGQEADASAEQIQADAAAARAAADPADPTEPTAPKGRRGRGKRDAAQPDGNQQTGAPGPVTSPVPTATTGLGSSDDEQNPPVGSGTTLAAGGQVVQNPPTEGTSAAAGGQA